MAQPQALNKPQLPRAGGRKHRGQGRPAATQARAQDERGPNREADADQERQSDAPGWNVGFGGLTQPLRERAIRLKDDCRNHGRRR